MASEFHLTLTFPRRKPPKKTVSRSRNALIRKSGPCVSFLASKDLMDFCRREMAAASSVGIVRRGSLCHMFSSVAACFDMDGLSLGWMNSGMWWKSSSGWKHGYGVPRSMRNS